jgi:hypothetical protein
MKKYINECGTCGKECGENQYCPNQRIAFVHKKATEVKNRIRAKFLALDIPLLKETLRGLYNDRRDGAQIAFQFGMEVLMERIQANEYIEFCDNDKNFKS